MVLVMNSYSIYVSVWTNSCAQNVKVQECEGTGEFISVDFM